MEPSIPKSKFKARALEYFRKVQETGQPIIVTERGKPVLRVVPYVPSSDEVLRILRGSVLAYNRPTEPVDVDAWESLE
ncbi:type II toxin-antitoxin system Phd/YefM family antitoxin [Limnochorda pilosa]|uniref:Antitoxin n=1 Tax=Limnochorda pilosa TaxID=1555112 RepID=A0A0K2SME3_LIMPI|nr:type II toxin-antitoxin system prevent-host-death family antitoxin [Limnochorda pilosa]BAS28286.1 prevent-host-death protein [Limnochorda pilosa]